MNLVADSIIGKVRTNLEAIDSATSPYTNTVQLVSEDLLTPNQILQRGALPAINIIDKGEPTPIVHTNQGREMWLEIMLLLYIRAEPGTDAATTVRKFIADVIYALTSSATQFNQGGTAVYTEYRGRDIIAVEDVPLAGAAVDFGIRYNNTWLLP